MSKDTIFDKETFKFNSYGFNRHFSSLGSKVRRSIYRQFLELTQGSTAIVLHNQGHATKLVTLDHVLPTTVPHSDIVWH